MLKRITALLALVLMVAMFAAGCDTKKEEAKPQEAPKTEQQAAPAENDPPITPETEPELTPEPAPESEPALEQGAE